MERVYHPRDACRAWPACLLTALLLQAHARTHTRPHDPLPSPPFPAQAWCATGGQPDLPATSLLPRAASEAGRRVRAAAPAAPPSPPQPQAFQGPALTYSLHPGAAPPAATSTGTSAGAGAGVGASPGPAEAPPAVLASHAPHTPTKAAPASAAGAAHAPAQHLAVRHAWGGALCGAVWAVWERCGCCLGGREVWVWC